MSSSSNVLLFSQDFSETAMEAEIKVLNNDLIWKEIVGYLGVSDLRVLATSCKYFFDKCNDVLKFTSSFDVSSRDELPNCFYNLKLTKVNVQLIDYKTEDDLKLTLQDFENVQILTLRSNDSILSIIDDIYISGLINIISHCPKLRCLTFDSHRFFEKCFKPFYANPLVKTTLSGLEELHILWRYYFPDVTDDKTMTEYIYRTTFPNPDYDVIPDLNMKLKVFHYKESDADKTLHFQPKNLRSSFDSLQELNLHICNKGLNTLPLLQFSELKKFEVVFRPTSKAYRSNETNSEYGFTPCMVKKLIPFLQNHMSTLQEFKICFFNVGSLEPLCQLFKRSQKIKMLKIICRDFVTTYLQNTDWEFLASLTALEKFKFKFGLHGNIYDDAEMSDTSDDEDEPDDILFEEADNELLDEQIIEEEKTSDDEDERSDISSESEEDNELLDEQNPRVNNWNTFLTSFPTGMKSISLCRFHYQGRQEDLLPTVKMALSRYENLTYLSMEKCENFLNDETLQFICFWMVKLQTLKGEFNNVTDFGISGLRTDGTETGISLQNLKGLKKLAIYSGFGKRNCRDLHITWEGLLCSVVFQHLMKLIIHGKLMDTHIRNSRVLANNRRIQLFMPLPEVVPSRCRKDERNYLKLIKQNPCLEMFELSFFEPSKRFRKKADKMNPRIMWETKSRVLGNYLPIH